MVINDVKSLLGLTGSTADNQLNTIINIVEARIRNRLEGIEEIPEELEYIITEVTVARYNQIGSEGTSSHTVAQESMSWADDLLAPYMDDLQDYLTRQETARRGRLRFL